MSERVGKIDSKSIEDGVIWIQSRSMSDPTLSDIDFKSKMAWVWTTVKMENQFENFSQYNFVDHWWLINYDLSKYQWV